MEYKKEQQIQAFRSWLTEHNIHFEEHANGHFQIFDTISGDLLYQVWPTTQKMIDNPADGLKQIRWVGMGDIRKILSSIYVGIIHEEVVAAKTTTLITEDNIFSNNLRKQFKQVYNDNKGAMDDSILVVAICLPTGATEIITNHFQVESKMEYYLKAYDDDFRLRTNDIIKITGFMLV